MRKFSSLAVLLALVASTASAAAGSVEVLEGAVPADAKVVSVDIKKMKYEPADLEIAAGTIVKWTNADAIPHNVQMPAPIDVMGSMLRAGQSFAMKFNDPGEYAYVCTPHPFMKGKIVVRPKS
jgi:amicyanin